MTSSCTDKLEGEGVQPPAGYRFDPFADVRMGVSLFQMSPEDWLVRDDARPPQMGDK